MSAANNEKISNTDEIENPEFSMICFPLCRKSITNLCCKVGTRTKNIFRLWKIPVGAKFVGGNKKGTLI